MPPPLPRQSGAGQSKSLTAIQFVRSCSHKGTFEGMMLDAELAHGDSGLNLEAVPTFNKEKASFLERSTNTLPFSPTSFSAFPWHRNCIKVPLVNMIAAPIVRTTCFVRTQVRLVLGGAHRWTKKHNNCWCYRLFTLVISSCDTCWSKI